MKTLLEIIDLENEPNILNGLVIPVRFSDEVRAMNDGTAIEIPKKLRAARLTRAKQLRPDRSFKTRLIEGKCYLIMANLTTNNPKYHGKPII